MTSNNDQTNSVVSIKRYRDEQENDHVGLFLRKGDGSQIQLILDIAVLGRLSDLRTRLLRAGVPLSSIEPAIATILSTIPDQAALLVRKPGWIGRSFVMLSGHVIGSDNVLLHPDYRQDVASLSTYNLADWNARIVKLAKGAPIPFFAILHALAAPLLKFSQLSEGALFHVHGPSSTGKSSITSGGGSVQGAPTCLETWDGSRRGLFERASSCNDHQLILDDTSTLSDSSKKDIKSLIYQLASGSSTSQSSVVHDRLPPLSWNLWGFSTGEVSMAQLLGTHSTSGLRARIIDVPVPSLVDGGVWWTGSEKVFDEPARRSATLMRQSTLISGHAMQSWIRHLVAEQDTLESLVRHWTQRFLDKLVPGASGLKLRIAQRFALIFAAGRIAESAQILDCERAEIRHAVASVMRLVLPGAEPRSVVAKRIQQFARGTDIVSISGGDHYPKFLDKSCADGFVKVDGHRRRLQVKKDHLDSLLGEDADAIRADWVAKSIITLTVSGELTKQQRVRVGRKLVKSRYVEIDLRRLKDLIY